LTVAGRELRGVAVVDLDASIVFAASDKENAQPTYNKGGIGFCPNLATCDNTEGMLAIDPRPGGATSHCAADNIALLDLAVSRLPGRYRRRLLVRLDGAGFSHDLLEHIASSGGTRGRSWEFSVGWSCTDKETDAIQALPTDAWTPWIDQNGDTVHDTFVADLTGLLDLGSWHNKIPGLRIIVRDEPLHPRYRKRPTDREKQLGRRYQLIATNTKVGQIAWLDARHRSHVHVENDVTQAKALGLNRWPSRHWTINMAWTQIVALAANLLACFRHLALPEGELRDAAPTLLRYRLLHLPRLNDPRTTHTVAPPPRRLALDQRRDQHLASGQSTPRTDLTTTTPPRRSWKEPRPERGTRRARRDSRTPTLPPNRKP
jgi:hypothetical protein